VAVSSRRPGSGIDNRADLFVGKWMRGKAREPASALSRAGDMETAVVLVTGTYLISRLTDNQKLAETSSLSAEALLNAGLWNVALKNLSSRARPGEGSSGTLLDGRGSSFPSGHAMGAFAVAAVVSEQYADKRWVPWVAYGSASLIAASRVALGKHYLSDVAAGATLGRSLGLMVVARAREEEPPRSSQWSPIVDPSHRTLGVSYSVSW
jgi:hypothetical protein